MSLYIVVVVAEIHSNIFELKKKKEYVNNILIKYLKYENNIPMDNELIKRINVNENVKNNTHKIDK